MKKIIKIKDLTEQEINYWIAKLVLKYPDQGYTVFISPTTEKCIARKQTGLAPCAYTDLVCDFARLWDSISKALPNVDQLIPTDPVESLRYVLTLRYGETLESDC